MPSAPVTTPTVEPPSPPVPPRRRRRPGLGAMGRLLVVATVLALGGGGVWAMSTLVRLRPGPIATDVPDLRVEAVAVLPGSAAPNDLAPVPSGVPEGAQPQAGPSVRDPLADWVNRVATNTGIPARAVRAYVNAELVLRQTEPGCHISWATLAGIGRVESNHGRYGGATLLDNGYPSKPIIGVPLDGSGVQSIPDTDGGALDGDPVYDHAVGPMQFIPSTWRKWASDGNRDGKADPQQIDDAALAAARYFCAGGRDMSTPSGWWSGVFSYNASVQYGQQVFGLADGYARASAGR